MSELLEKIKTHSSDIANAIKETLTTLDFEKITNRTTDLMQGEWGSAESVSTFVTSSNPFLLIIGAFALALILSFTKWYIKVAILTASVLVLLSN